MINNVKHFILFLYIRNCIHVSFSFCDDVHCMPQSSILCNNIFLVTQSTINHGYELIFMFIPILSYSSSWEMLVLLKKIVMKIVTMFLKKKFPMTIFQNSNATSPFPSIEYRESSSINDLVIDWKKQHWIEDYQIGIVAIRSAVEQMKQY